MTKGRAMRAWTFASAGQLIFGRDSSQELAYVLERYRPRSILLVSDRHLTSAGLTERIRSVAVSSGAEVTVYDHITPEPTLEIIRCALDVAQPVNPEVIIGLGGGSNMDAAKLVALGLNHGGDLRDYVGENRVPGPIRPLVCLPTTAGTGSEVSSAAVFTDTQKNIKVSCLSPFLRPAVAIVDPLLTVGCPAHVTAHSGIDALTHAIEAYTAVDNDQFPLPPGERSVYQGKNPLADMFARESVRLIGQYLRRAFQNGKDIEAREAMSLAATLAGLAFSNAGVALVHAMEYPVGGAVHISHGAGNGLLLPYVMQYNKAKRIREFADIARWLNVAQETATDEANADAAIEAIHRLKSHLGIPLRLRDIGVTEGMLPDFAAKAFAIKRLMRVNPRYPESMEEILSIYKTAY